MDPAEASDRMLLVLASASRPKINPVELADVCEPFYATAGDLYGLVVSCLEIIRQFGNITPGPDEMAVLEVEDNGMPLDPKAAGVLAAARMMACWVNGDRATADALYWPMTRDEARGSELADLVVVMLRTAGMYLRRHMATRAAHNN